MWVLILGLIALALGGWMIFDGAHVLRTGKYFGPDIPGPWRHVPQALGFDPFSLGPLFIALGTLWVVAGLMALFGKLLLWPMAVLAILSLWYLPLGTLLSVAVLALLFGPAGG